MLTLAGASAYFDRTEVLDPVSGARLFYGQLAPYDDSKRDAASAYRRIMSVVPGTAMPAGGAVRVLGQVWLVGAKEVDGLELAHRDKYVLHPAQALHNASRLPGFLQGTVAATLWADVSWVRDGKELETSSRAVGLHTAYMPVGADVREYDILWAGADAYLVGSVHLQPSGFQSASCVKLEYPAGNVTLSTRVYDAAAGSYSASVASTVKGLRVRWQSLYAYGSQADARFQEGDTSLVLPAGTVVKTSDTVVVSGATWGVLAVEAIGGAVVVHGRPR